MSTAEAEPFVWTVGERFRKARKRAGHTQESLAAVLGISKQMVNAIEQNGSRPRRYQVEALARLAGVPAEAMASEAEMQPDPLSDAEQLALALARADGPKPPENRPRRRAKPARQGVTPPYSRPTRQISTARRRDNPVRALAAA